MGKNFREAEYEARSAAIFGTQTRSAIRAQHPDELLDTKDGGRQQSVAGSSPPPTVGGFLLTGSEVVHGLLNLREITDPDRWLKRHLAPVALDTGATKRFLAGDVLRWAADKFAVSDTSKAALQHLARAYDEVGTAQPDHLPGDERLTALKQTD